MIFVIVVKKSSKWVLMKNVFIQVFYEKKEI